MIDLRALFYGLAGAGRLIRLDTSGLKTMRGGSRGFWTSLIYSALLVLPLYGLLHLLQFDPAKHNGFRFLIANIETYVLAWLMFPLVMERATHYMRRRDRFLDFIIPYNWLSCLYNIMFITLGLAQAVGMISWEAAASISVGLNVAGFVWIGYLARHTLSIPYSAAIGLIILDLFLSIMISLLNASLLHGQTGL